LKAETIIARHASSKIIDPTPHQPGSCQGYEHRQAIKSEHLQGLRISVDFSQEDIESSVPKRFEQIVRKYSDRLAVKAPGGSLTYRELNAMANRVAWALLPYPVSETQPVAILFDKGAELIAAILGVLKAGRFLALLDPSYPNQRLVSMLADSQAWLLMTDGKNNSLGREIISGDQKLLNFASLDQTMAVENPALHISPNAFAFIAYTSGTTGQPKAVIQNHRNFLSDSAYHACAYSVTENDRYGHLTSGTSSAVKTAVHPLMKGAAVLLFDIKAQGVNRLARWLVDERVSICNISAALYRSFCATLTGREYFSDLRFIRLSGETIYKSDHEVFRKHFAPSCSLLSGLNTTEAGAVCLYFMNHQTVLTGKEVPVGYPVEGKEILLLDDDGNDVAKGQVGEIVVRSEYLSPGYWRRPDLTDAKFKPDPTGGPKRLYYTGDLGLMLSDGCLIHKGRKDFRVKLRGYGVDLVEVERALVEHPAIEKAVVVAAKNDSGDNYLISYFTSTATPPPSVSILRSHLSATLPDYSVPAFFIQLETLPLTSNGKIDRNALPRPDRLRPNLSVPYVEPRNPEEKKLADIWAEVLGVERVGVRDDFFDLGGHSLLAAKLFTRIKKTFDNDLSPPTLLYARTVEQLAEIVNRESASAPSSLLVPLQRNGTHPPLFWTGGYGSDIYLPRLLGEDQPVYGLLNQCHNGHKQLYNRLEDIAAHHLREIRAVQSRGPYFLGGVCFGGMVAFELAQQLKKQGEEVELLFLVDLATIKNVKSLTDRIPDSPKRLSTESFRDKVVRHFGALAKMTPRKQFAYVWIRVVDRIKALTRNTFKDLLWKGCLLTGWPIPVFCQSQYTNQVDIQVLQKYQPKPYSGRMIHIKAEQSAYNPQLVAMLSAGQMETYELPCSHNELLREPDIAIWTKELRAYLQKAQIPQQGSRPSRS